MEPDDEVSKFTPGTPEYEAWKARISTNERLSLLPTTRLVLATSGSFLVGMGLGLSHGSQIAGLRFRAENAHRLPSTPTGWYLYHKSKNYHLAFGGLKEGLKMGTKISFWAAAFFGVEWAWDEFRGSKDVVNTVLASTSVAGAFSLWNRFPMYTAARTIKTGLAIGLGFGFMQDAVGFIRGRRPGYVDFVLRRGRRKGAEEERASLVT